MASLAEQPEVAGPPAIITAWEQGCDARMQALMKQYPPGVTVPESVSLARTYEDVAAFGVMFEQLTGAQYQAEMDRLNRGLVDDPTNAYWPALRWSTQQVAYAARRHRELGEAELPVIACAERALRRCTYLGGLPAHPNRGESDAFFCSLGGELSWQDRRGLGVVDVPWRDLSEIRVGPTDRSPDRLTASRVAAVGVFALGARKQRREAMLGVRTSSGEGIFVVHGFPPLELQAQLAPLRAAVGKPTSHDYWNLVQMSGPDPRLFEAAQQLVWSH